MLKKKESMRRLGKSYGKKEKGRNDKPWASKKIGGKSCSRRCKPEEKRKANDRSRVRWAGGEVSKREVAKKSCGKT